ncbi:hypothetical protein TSUD_385620 [Trifolium subterraneum]|uniref:Uncharacterized protein n=1 Tax=Trifolium subterraneum TaxID=3900 RepID=A0A2Z6LVD4_TRISU|nr:hypothetical protein TSUD_385620 [Trifolium subterraneum]
MAAQTIAETAQKTVTPETLLYAAAKLSERCLNVPISLIRAIKKYPREQEELYMKRKLLSLSQSFNDIKDVNLQTSREIVEDPLKSFQQSKCYRDEQTNAYVASRIPVVYSACYKLLKELRRRLPGFSPANILDFGARRTGLTFWSLQEVWPKSLEKVNLIQPSQSMQHAGQNLIQEDGLKLQQANDAPHEVVDAVTYDSNAMETNGGGGVDDDGRDEEEEDKEEIASAPPIFHYMHHMRHGIISRPKASTYSIWSEGRPRPKTIPPIFKPHPKYQAAADDSDARPMSTLVLFIHFSPFALFFLFIF